MRTRRTFKSELKAKVVLECISGEKGASEVCREFQRSPVLASKWRTEFIENAAIVVEKNSKEAESQDQIADLEHLAGRHSLGNDMLKKPPTS